jgi:short-subunit dehydrogenase
MPRKLRDAVVVITGASSGIGRATALRFAERGATVVVAARREQALNEVVREIEQRGGRGLAVSTDVTDEGAVQALARRALVTFGRIDVWVNNAALSLFGRFEETPPEDYRRVIEVDLFGYIHGARAALPIFREQGSGVLINTASIVATIPQPYTSPYVISKHGIRALGMSLRQELSLDGGHDIHVCTVMPATVDTPFFQHAANYTGRAVKAMPPVVSADRVASTIVSLAERPRREVIVGNAGRMLTLMRAISPGMAERMMARQVDQTHLYRDKPASPTSGNLWEPMRYTSVSGGWTASGVQQDEAAPQRRRGLAGLAALGVGLLAWWSWRQYRERQARRASFFGRLAPARALGSDGVFENDFFTRIASTRGFRNGRLFQNGFFERIMAPTRRFRNGRLFQNGFFERIAERVTG